MKYHIGVWIAFSEQKTSEPGLGHASFEDFLDEVMGHLLDNPDVEDPSIGGSLAQRNVEFSVTLTLPDEAVTEQVVDAGMTAVRAAIHAARGGTADWPPYREGELAAGPLQPA